MVGVPPVHKLRIASVSLQRPWVINMIRRWLGLFLLEYQDLVRVHPLLCLLSLPLLPTSHHPQICDPLLILFALQALHLPSASQPFSSNVRRRVSLSSLRLNHTCPSIQIGIDVQAANLVIGSKCLQDRGLFTRLQSLSESLPQGTSTIGAYTLRASGIVSMASGYVFPRDGLYPRFHTLMRSC